ncbi:hypothetical protein FHS61_000374 [Altererythrobacter atlanticus]|uniref:Uncharacterized protein n=1 Tax=Croceibacterium atlanticum TaxID=1267766 RepID=A0A0F7KSP1_9SPHN|nr:hypothetical protein [Croceibacterium atlanticum]AKH42604.1 hypothetical protein WYH_01565 [Croceibacterium atlanticum]MBB5731381.1 hypothetical protein [Croceibacterium atlanticum]
MKLTQDQTDQIQQKTGLEPVPTEIAQQSGLANHFGDETFYLNADGIFVFEQGRDPSAEDSGDAGAVTAIKIASVEQVGEANEVAVRAIEPQQTTLTVELA